jgi:hypothetical protein
LDFLNNLLGSYNVGKGLGCGFFLVTFLFIDDDKVRGGLSPLPYLLGAKTIIEESPGE